MCPCLLRHLDGLYLSDKTGGNCNKMTGSSHPRAVPSRQVLLHVCVCVCMFVCVWRGGGVQGRTLIGTTLSMYVLVLVQQRDTERKGARELHMEGEREHQCDLPLYFGNKMSLKQCDPHSHTHTCTQMHRLLLRCLRQIQCKNGKPDSGKIYNLQLVMKTCTEFRSSHFFYYIYVHTFAICTALDALCPYTLKVQS